MRWDSTAYWNISQRIFVACWFFSIFSVFMRVKERIEMAWRISKGVLSSDGPVRMLKIVFWSCPRRSLILRAPALR